VVARRGIEPLFEE